MENDAIITLYDEDGNPVDFEFLDLIMLRGQEYVVLLENNSDCDEVTILRLDSEEDADKDIDYSVDEDEAVLNEVFEIFRHCNADRFNFEN